MSKQSNQNLFARFFAVIILSHILKLGAKSFTQILRFLAQGLPFAFAMFVHVSERELFFHQVVANLPQNASELLRFLKTFFQKAGFWIKIDKFFFFWKKNEQC